MVWRQVQNRIATLDNIVGRGITVQGHDKFVGGYGSEESVSHIFFECNRFAGVWNNMCSWLGVLTDLHNKGWQHMIQFENLLDGGKSTTLKLLVMWCACICSIWKSRNHKIFRNEKVQTVKVIEEAKMCAWKWLKIKSKLIKDDFDMWCLNPKASLCFMAV